MSKTVWGILAIILIAVIFEVSPRVGWGLAILAGMLMIANYYKQRKTT